MDQPTDEQPKEDISVSIVKGGRMFNLLIKSTSKGIKAIVMKGSYIVNEKIIHKVCVPDIQDWAETVIDNYKIDR